MNWELITVVVAAVFGAIGLVFGFIIAKSLGGRKKEEEERLAILEERLIGVSERTISMAEELKSKIKELREDKLKDIRQEIEALQLEIHKLKKELATLPVSLSPSSYEALEKSEEILKEIEFNLPSIDNSLLTQVKDSLLILRNDVQNLAIEAQKSKEPAVDPVFLKDLLDTVESAVSISRNINASLVKDELLALAHSIKLDDGSELTKDLDAQALNAKELVVLLEELKERIKKELEGVAR
ncbi:hypothetical protein [Thermovibrio ammonificans]|uniref:Uncharacterized protein n=1 Tax=Thermovibrio ammonificans (strain DSM 15698 / JCM 12110 / HB-1) TaxID=648996 RepID=E8T602_THEA1|nr:hypothetical protein [Thermovibrio ammonificans]ADU96586.1 hypothetical protein Theam_0614 [Thermovibrio ammonificans HB-1]